MLELREHYWGQVSIIEFPTHVVDLMRCEGGQSPEYGLAFAKAPFDCQVVGFDASPVSLKWWEKKRTKPY
jgi:hypothetical protein